jgi:hypothetical protein
VEKDVERTEQEWNDKEPPAIYGRKAMEKLKNNNCLDLTIL